MVGDTELRFLRTVVVKESHVLQDLFPEKVQKHYNLRPRPRDFKFPAKDD